LSRLLQTVGLKRRAKAIEPKSLAEIVRAAKAEETAIIIDADEDAK